ncbi:Hypothetical predicted protein [Mytilus galloprovincialis]|uniref:Mitochondria-eating protein n=1 Tax=Mytilus galloprovincialis TaxID=29158 RepID=A0A8B6FGG0_MYTGA|nr:Hypothetical predicted protein [Mytilus galloprovincialis]
MLRYNDQFLLNLIHENATIIYRRKVINYNRLLVEIWTLGKEHSEVLKKTDEPEIPEELKSSECSKHFKVLIAANNALKSIKAQEASMQDLQKTIEELKEKLDSKEVEVKTNQHKSVGKNSTSSDTSSSTASVDIGTQQEPTMTVRSAEVRPQTDITEESRNYQRLLGEIMSLKENHKHLLKNPDLSASPDDLTSKECSTHFDVLVSINNFLKSMDVQKKDQESFVEEMVQKLTKVLQENQKLLEDNEKMKTDIERYTSKKPTQEIKKLIYEIDALKKSLQNEEKEREKLKMTIQAKEKDIHLLNQKLQMQRPQTAPLSYAKEYKEMSKQVENLKAEKESLMQRLSMVAGRKMKDNNPSIADLSDPNRPERLVEQFREIYDNAWTDVLDHLTEHKDVTDAEAVKEIVNVLQAIHNQCKDQMNGKKQSIIKIIGYPEDTLERQYTGDKEGHDPTVKIIKDLVQASANRISAEVIQEIKKCPVVEDILRKGGGKSEIFVNKCSLLCLFMVVQDPPVVLDFSCQPGDPFNKDMFTPFTSSGEVVDYLVWPLMYLNQGGAIMSKGIAQGKKTIKQKQDEDNSN